MVIQVYALLRRKLLFAVLGVCLFPVMACAATADTDQDILITTGPSWNGFTNKDGSGLYHDIIQLIYGSRYRIKHLYVPSLQANNLVAAGRADIKMCETRTPDSLQSSAYPMYENLYFATFLKDNHAQWQGPAAMAGKRVAWSEGYYSQSDFPVDIIAMPVRSGEAALMMVILGRADYYIDDLKLIYESFDAAKIRFDPETFGLVKVGQRKYYPVFGVSARGDRLREEFDRGMGELLKKGKLPELYRKWGFPVPEFTQPRPDQTAANQ